MKFNKSYTEKGELQYSMYTLGQEPAYSEVIPIGIVLDSNNRITVFFDTGVKHIIHYAEDVELFIRPKLKEKKQEDGTTTDSGDNKGKVGRGKNTG